MSDDPWSGVARPFSNDWDTQTPLEKAEEALYEEWRRQHPRSLKEYGRSITVDANMNVVATSGYEETPMPEDLTEERLAEFERNDYGPAVAALVAEVKRLRKIVDGEHHKSGAFDRMADWAQQMENERDEARSMLKQAVSYLYCHVAAVVREWTLEMNQLFVKWADEDREQRKLKPALEGEIKVGERFIWEPRSAAYERIIVTEVRVSSDGKAVIESVDSRGERHWNDEARFREACIRMAPE